MDKRLILLCAIASCSALVPQSFQISWADTQKDATPPTSAAANNMANTAYGSHLEPILRAIQATPDQRKQITETFEEFRPKIQPLKAKYKDAQQQFLNAMMEGRSAEEIMLKQQDMNALYSRIVDQYCAMHLKVRKLLSPSQAEQYEQYRTKQGWTHPSH